MDELQFKEKLAEALHEPAVPPELVENTVARVRTMELGLKAEHHLRDDQALTAEERVTMLADCVLGRLARSGRLPLGADTKAMKAELMHNRRFLGLAEQDPKVILAGLDNGKLSGEVLYEKSSVQEKNIPKHHSPAKGHR